jgi:L-amino acid N-acyltransferase YncA
MGTGTTPELYVRPFTRVDVAPANRVTNHYIRHTAVHFGTEPASDEEFEAGWLEGREQYPWLAAEVGNQFAGYAKAYQWRSREAYRRTAEVGIYVDPSFQRRGVGKALYAELIRACRGMGFRTLVAGIALPNEGSVRLHESCGFVHVGTFQAVGRKFEEWHDVGFWQLML